MATLSESARLTDAESADLLDRVARFRAAWAADGSTRPDAYLPPHGTRHRPAVLVQIVTADMERRAAAGEPFRAEQYVNYFPDELSTAEMPAALLAAEYRLRHRYTDKPALTEYQRWFPAQFDALVAHLADLPPLPSAGPGDPLHDPGATPVGTLGDGRAEAGKTRISGLAATGKVEVRPVAAAIGRSGIPSDMLPSDAPYQLVRRIGSGAFGEVFEALAPGGVKVAVKRILRSVDHPASVSEKEALEAIKGLSHPFLLKTNAYWVFDDKLVIVMELADGSLTDRIVYHQERGLPGVPPEELVPFFEQTGEALDYLHSQNVSHRDVKPENLLMQKGYAKVADFGLARLHEHAMTVVRNTVGTPAFMAPEMWQQKLSLQSDQYSLAATYVRARLGRHLFDTNVLVDMANSHINTTPKLDPLPAAEQAVLLRALAKKPDDRFPSCLAFAEALREAVFPPPPVPEPEVVHERTGMLVQAVVVAVTCALAVGLVIWFMIPRPDPSKPDSGKNEKEPEKQAVVPEKRYAVYPKGWERVASAGEQQIGDKYYHNRLTRRVANETLVAILVSPTRPDDPAAFYMLQNKITNRVFVELWNQVTTAQSSTVETLATRNPAFVGGNWRNGAVNTLKGATDNGHFLGIDGAQAGVPVLGVTLPQALLAAAQVGGKLPTTLQWKKAAGLLGDDDPRPGPAGAKLATAPADARRKELATRNLALGLREGPWPIDKQTSDMSYCGIHQLVTNGQEWLRQDVTGRELVVGDLPLGAGQAAVAGQGYNELEVPTKGDDVGSQLWVDTTGSGATGFRIVLEPK